MAAIPMQEEPGVQELYTRDYGTVKVKGKSWQDGGFHIVPCPNGTYQHANGLPIKDEKEIHAAFGRDEEGNCPNEEAKQKCLNWFRNRHEQLANPVRPIGFNSDGVPVFGDGTVADFSDLYAFWKPILPNGKPNRTLIAAIAALQDYNDYQQSGQAPKELRTEAPKPEAPVEAAPPPSPAERDKMEALKAKERIEANISRKGSVRTEAQKRADQAKSVAAKARAAAVREAQGAVPQG